MQSKSAGTTAVGTALRKRLTFELSAQTEVAEITNWNLDMDVHKPSLLNSPRHNNARRLHGELKSLCVALDSILDQFEAAVFDEVPPWDRPASSKAEEIRAYRQLAQVDDARKLAAQVAAVMRNVLSPTEKLKSDE